MAELAPPDRKEDVRATEKDKVCLGLLCVFFCHSELFNKRLIFVEGGDLQKLQAW